MRNIRTATVASATALTIALGGTSVALAQEANDATSSADQTSSSSSKERDRQVIFDDKQETDKEFKDVVSDGVEGLRDGKGSSKFFDDAEKPFFPTDAFGKNTNPEQVGQWARYWIDGTVIAGIGALVGLIIAGFNFASYNGWINF